MSTRICSTHKAVSSRDTVGKFKEGYVAVQELRAMARALEAAYLPRSWNVMQYRECIVPTWSTYKNKMMRR